MPGPWSEARKKQLLAMRAVERSSAEIAKTLGLPRDKVIEQLQRLDTLARNKAMVDRALRKRAELRNARAR
jgi:hypothetical protein